MSSKRNPRKPVQKAPHKIVQRLRKVEGACRDLKREIDALKGLMVALATHTEFIVED